METIEGNKLIGEFMGYTYGNISGWVHGSRIGFYKKDDTGNIVEFYNENNLKYNSSWDWLMPVVEKINTVCIERGGELSNHSRDQEELSDPLDNPKHWKSWSYHYIHLSTKRESVWNDVVEFIEWYNKEIL